MNSNFNQSENQIQRGKNYKIPLIVIGLLIIVLIGVFIFFNIKKHDTANIYYTVIDNMSEFLTNALEENNLVNPIGYEGTIKTNININDSDNAEFYKILNNSTLSFDLERDINKKVVNLNLGLLYNNNSINGDFWLKNNEIYADLKDLYNTPLLLLKDESFDSLWEESDTTDLKGLVEELSKELKNSLKQEYFKTTKESISINNSNVKVIKHTLNLNSDNLYQFQKDLLDNIGNNTTLISILSTLSSEDGATLIEDAKDNIEKGSLNLEINVYLNAKDDNVEKIEIIYKENSDNGIIEFIKTQEDKYEINITENGSSQKIGEILFNDNEFNLRFDLDGDEIAVNYKDNNNENNLTITASIGEEKGSLTLVTKEKEGSLSAALINGSQTDSDYLNLKLDINFKEKTINNVTERDTSKAKNIEELDDTDYNEILTNAMQNPLIVSIIGEFAETDY